MPRKEEFQQADIFVEEKIQPVNDGKIGSPFNGAVDAVVSQPGEKTINEPDGTVRANNGSGVNNKPNEITINSGNGHQPDELRGEINFPPPDEINGRDEGKNDEIIFHQAKNKSIVPNGRGDNGKKQAITKGEIDFNKLSKLYEKNKVLVTGYLYNHLKNRSTAEELASEVWLRVITNIGRFRAENDGSFKAWLMRITSNLLVDHYRTSVHRNHVELEDYKVTDNKIEDIEEKIDRSELFELIDSIVRNLSGDDVEIFQLMRKNLSSSEIGVIINKKPGAVRVWKHRLLGKIRERLDELGIYDY